MKKVVTFLFLAGSLVFNSCGNKAADNQTQNSEALQADSVSSEILADRNMTITDSVKSGGHTYRYTIARNVDKTLPVVKDELNQKFYDNKVSLTILRDGQAFFSKQYQKNDFNGYLTEEELKKSTLQGMAFYKVMEGQICFGAAVGAPGDDGTPFVIKISSSGSMSIAKDNVIDTSANTGEDIGD